MKKKTTILLGLLAATVFMATGCGEAKESFTPEVIVPESSVPESTSVEKETQSSVSEKEPETDPIPANSYRSELTNEWISNDLQKQRPIAAMVDNELTALDHFGVNDADIVYELINSTKNGYVTRLMVVMKDWGSITQLGSIRSARPSNFVLAAEYNAILCHDGGPFYIDPYVSKSYTNNFSGGFARFTNGKPSEFTEYITFDNYKNPNTGTLYDGLEQRLKDSKYSTTYNEYYPGKHFTFADGEYFLADSYKKTQSAAKISLPFPHNSSTLSYNTETGLYEYGEYGDEHVDALTGEVTSFKNVILQSCDFIQYDENGYLRYLLVTDESAADPNYPVHQLYRDESHGTGYYITNGEAIPITWSKTNDEAVTVFKSKETGQVITLNTGKTYIGIVPSQFWDDLSIK